MYPVDRALFRVDRIHRKTHVLTRPEISSQTQIFSVYGRPDPMLGQPDTKEFQGEGWKLEYLSFLEI